MLIIEELNPETARVALPDLVEVLRDCVLGGASIGFILPFSPEDAAHYWEAVFEEVADGTLVLLVAKQDGKLLGTAQLALPWKPNGRYRGEVQKVMVHRDGRKQGIGLALMQAIEASAEQHGRTVLVLDTATEEAKRLYLRMGYQVAGDIPQYALDVEATYLMTTTNKAMQPSA
jgi:ribosomal protein S18 acetylase RimI-like enzyme